MQTCFVRQHFFKRHSFSCKFYKNRKIVESERKGRLEEGSLLANCLFVAKLAACLFLIRNKRPSNKSFAAMVIGFSAQYNFLNRSIWLCHNFHPLDSGEVQNKESARASNVGRHSFFHPALIPFASLTDCARRRRVRAL